MAILFGLLNTIWLGWFANSSEKEFLPSKLAQQFLARLTAKFLVTAVALVPGYSITLTHTRFDGDVLLLPRLPKRRSRQQVQQEAFLYYKKELVTLCTVVIKMVAE
jgi:hypothetical protein